MVASPSGASSAAGPASGAGVYLNGSSAAAAADVNGVNGHGAAINGVRGGHGRSMSMLAHKYRGAVVEDLQLPPAFALPHDEVIGRAIELAYDRDFSHIPVLSHERKPLGYLDVPSLKAKWEAGQADTNDSVLKYMTKFRRGPSHKYTLVTPETPLDELEDFLESNLFALVTDYQRKFVLAVATKQDLDNFVTRRGLAV